jgi:hypothetical protein
MPACVWHRAAIVGSLSRAAGASQDPRGRSTATLASLRELQHPPRFAVRTVGGERVLVLEQAGSAGEPRESARTRQIRTETAQGERVTLAG